MKRQTANIVLALLLFAGESVHAQSWLAWATIKESKIYVNKEIMPDEFTGIQVTGSMDVNYTQKPGKPVVKVYSSDNVVEALDIYVKDKTLYIKFKKGLKVKYSKLKIDVSSAGLEKIGLVGSGSVNVTDRLETGSLEASLTGSGDITGKGIRCGELMLSVSGSGDMSMESVECADVKASLSGSGDLTLKMVQAKSVSAAVAGSGDIRLNGSADEAEYSVAGSGDIHADKLNAKRVSASVSGSGDIKCQATAFLKVRTSGSGKVGYKGNPELDVPMKGCYKL